MDVLVKQALKEYFSDFKQYHLIILIGFTIIIALLQTIQSFIVAKKIEKLKAAFKKSEIKFSKYNELQVNALRLIYHHLVSFQLANDLLFKTEANSVDHTTYKNRINSWIKNYIECSREFSREKILLTEELKGLFSKTLGDFQEIKKILIDERKELDYAEMESAGNWTLMYDFAENELTVINDKINGLKEKESIKNSENHIFELRKKIEIVFKQMN